MVSIPELKKYQGKKVLLKLNSNREIAGILKGYDVFLNVVIEDGYEIIVNSNIQKPLGVQTLVRGNSVVAVEALETVV